MSSTPFCIGCFDVVKHTLHVHKRRTTPVKPVEYFTADVPFFLSPVDSLHGVETSTSTTRFILGDFSSRGP